MEQTLERLVAYARSKDTRLACAAAVVLAELAPREPGVARGLAEHLPRTDGVLRSFTIEALGRIGSPEAAAALVPFIEAGGPVGDEALRAVAHAGAGALKPLVRLLGKAPAELRAKLSEAIARTGESQGYAALLDALREADFDQARAIREGMHHALGGLGEKPRAVLLKLLLKALESKNFASREPGLVTVLELSGELREAEAASSLLAHALRPATPRARRAALLALARLELKPEKRAALAAKLFGLVEESDFDYAVEPAIAALREAKLGSGFRGRLQKLVGSPRPEVREFAMQQLAAAGGSSTLNELLDCLESADPSVREDAAEALAKAPHAAKALAERMLKSSSGEACRLAARILAGMAAQLPKPLLPELAKAYVAIATGKDKQAAAKEEAQRREAETRRAAFFLVCRATGSEILAELALKEARKVRAGGEPQRAANLLRALQGIPGWSDEHRVELALAGLATAPLDLSRAARGNETSLRLLENALGNGTLKPRALAKSIAGDPALSRKAVYYLGHHFAEGIGEQRELGRELLEQLSATRGDEGRQAKEKLALEGLAGKGAKKQSVLEERAKVLMAAADLAADAAKDEALRERKQQRQAWKDAQARVAEEKKRQQALQRAARKADQAKDEERAKAKAKRKAGAKKKK
ncbi:MAG: HEAT repeat domain-containing protein [Planctomycetota bacterium]|nr:HEAT repeat domain-containing protein [Planctomycetota bacterium]